MPMDFPDMESLHLTARVHKFRKPNEGENEAQYREALANHVSTIDYLESEEIRSSVGWDKWDDKQGKAVVNRKLITRGRIV